MCSVLAGHAAPEFGVVVIGVDDGNAIRLQAAKNAALLASHFVQVAHAFKVGALGVSDHRHGRCTEGRQVGDFTRAIHAHLDDSSAMRGAQPKQRQRQADVVIEVAASGEHGGAEGCLQNRGDHFLGRRLAVRASDGNDRQRELGAPGGCKVAEGEAGVIDDNGRNTSRHLAFIRHEQGSGACGHGLIEKIMCIETLAAQGDEELAVGNRTGVRRHAGHLDIGANQTAMGRLGDL